MAQIFEAIAKGNKWLNDIVWGVPALVLLMGAGIILTVGLKGFQFRKFGYAMKNTVGKMFKKQEAKAGEVTPLQALTTALAATVGTGNIAGITTAVTLGGAGSIFWLWISALLGMATKYSEVLLSVKFRERNAQGDWVGGPMYYIKNGLGKNWKWLGVVFCVFGGLASFGIGNAVQVGNITDSINTAIQAFVPAAAEHKMTINIVSPLIPSYATGLTTREILILEFSSTMMCLILAGKVGSNISSEIGTMRVTEQIDAMEIMGINSANFIVLPKIIGFVLFIPVLGILSMFFGLIGGAIIAKFTSMLTIDTYIYGIQSFFNEWYIWYSLIKCLVFAFIITSVAAYYGYHVKGGSLEVGQASTKAVVSSSIIILLADVILTKLLLQ